MAYALNSGENLLLNFGLIDLPSGYTWKGIWDSATAYVVQDAVLGTDNIGYGCILAHTNHAPPNGTYWAVLPDIDAIQVTGVVVELLNEDADVVVSYTHSRGVAQTSGLLVVGNDYIIKDFAGGDDFTNVGAASNATGVVFTATGDTPTDWTHESTLQQMIMPDNMTLEDGLLSVELLKEDTKPLDGSYELRVTISWASAVYFQSGSQTDVLCLADAIEITPC
jgi:hypothetical protein